MVLSPLTRIPEPEWFRPLFVKLLKADLEAQLPGPIPSEPTVVTGDDERRLVGHASMLAMSPISDDHATAYEIGTRLIELRGESNRPLVGVVDVLLSRLGNFPGRHLLRKRYAGSTAQEPFAPAMLALERIARETENSVVTPGGIERQLTDFQRDFFERLGIHKSVSVSGPTSAGKSFVMGLDLIRRLKSQLPACVVYVVPTRALIREVSQKLREMLRLAEMVNVPVRTVPFPIDREKAPNGAVFVLTQERLMSLLHSTQGIAWVTTLIVDEAQGIEDGSRGIILQSAVEAVVRKFPNAEIHFASPLAKNPDYLLRLFGREVSGRAWVEERSPVSQNLILVSEVRNKKTQAKFELQSDDGSIELGIRELGFSWRVQTGVSTQRAKLAVAITRDDDSTIIFGNTPSDTEELALALINPTAEPEVTDPDIREFIDFLRQEVHAEYPLIKTLPHSVAFHYGAMPSIVRARVEDLFKQGKLRFVCCTSTLLQGVNLPARHIVIENPKRGDPMSRRDFLNLAGRAGRLLAEFHGNVWCLRPSKWEEKSFQGDRLQDITAAMEDVMADGGSIIQRLLADEARSDEVDLAETTLGKVVCDFVKTGQSISESSFRTAENEAVLRETESQCQALQVTLPRELLDVNRAVRPDRLQQLYDYLRGQPSLALLVPLRPGTAQSNDRMAQIIQIIQEKLAGVSNQSYMFYKWLAIQWIYNSPLSKIIKDRERYLREQRGDERSTSVMIRELLSTLEDVIRFRLVKYFLAYTSILSHVLTERGEAEAAAAIEPFHIYLECGASDRTALNLIALGLSRVTALALLGKVRFKEDATPEDCLGQLANTNIATLAIPKLCQREINELLGRQQR